MIRSHAASYGTFPGVGGSDAGAGITRTRTLDPRSFWRAGGLTAFLDSRPWIQDTGS